MMARNGVGNGRMEYGRGKKAGPERLQLGMVITPDDNTLLNELCVAAAKRMGLARVTRTQAVQMALRALAREYGMPGYTQE